MATTKTEAEHAASSKDKDPVQWMELLPPHLRIYAAAAWKHRTLAEIADALETGIRYAARGLDQACEFVGITVQRNDESLFPCGWTQLGEAYGVYNKERIAERQSASVYTPEEPIRHQYGALYEQQPRREKTFLVEPVKRSKPKKERKPKQPPQDVDISSLEPVTEIELARIVRAMQNSSGTLRQLFLAMSDGGQTRQRLAERIGIERPYVNQIIWKFWKGLRIQERSKKRNVQGAWQVVVLDRAAQIAFGKNQK